jgi:MarR family transcriptional regulator, 2-MHQ and catechol-resistance regulon repressor
VEVSDSDTILSDRNELPRDASVPTGEDMQEYSQAFGSFIKLCRATWSVTARVAECLPGHITFAQFAVLEALHSLGPMFQRELSQRILRTSASVTAVVDGLESRGLVERARSKEDRRLVRVSLTPEGQAFMTEVLPVYMGRVREEFSVLSPTEQSELGRLCRTLGKRSEERE